MERSIEDIKAEADALGLTYPKNIKAETLQAKIDAAYDADSKKYVVEAKKEVEESKEEVEVKTTAATKKKSAKEIIKEQERKNLESVIVKITMVDKREASTATNVYFGNGDVAMNVPLDTFVEVPRIIAHLAETAKAVVHVDTPNGAAHKTQKKYVVEYKRD